MKPTYKTVLFDLDATLLDNHASFSATYDAYCARYPSVFDREDVASRRRLAMLYYRPKDRQEADYLQVVHERKWKEAPDFRVFMKQWMDTYASCAVLFPSSMEILQFLKARGIAVGLVSNGECAFQRAKLHSSGLDRILEAIVISGEVGIAKPDPKIFRIALEQLRADPRETLFVGNNPWTDIAGATDAGMDTLLITNSAESHGATYTGRDVSVIMELFK